MIHINWGLTQLVKPSLGWIRPGFFFGTWGIMVILEKMSTNNLDHGLGNTKSNFQGNLVWGNLVIWAGTHEEESKISKSMIQINRSLTQLVMPSQGWVQAALLVFGALWHFGETGPRYPRSWAGKHEKQFKVFSSIFHIKYWSVKTIWGLNYTCLREY